MSEVVFVRPTECGKCGQRRTNGIAPDPCLGWLPNVSWACCGHEWPKMAYVVLGGKPEQPAYSIRNEEMLRGEDALRYFAHAAGNEGGA